nr:histidine phosphatase family protein [Synechococcus sp. PCC 7502]
MITRVILVRHGESTSNSAGMVQGRGNSDRPDLQPPLTQKGQQQAKLAGLALANLAIDTAYCSPLVRANQTANLILENRSINLNTHENLREINLPQWEGLTFGEVRSQYPEQYNNWHHAPEQLEMSRPTGEKFYPVLDLFEQAQSVWAEILPKHDGQTVLLVAHSGINRALIASALGIAPSRYHYLHQSNCGISILNFRQSGETYTAQLESLNLVSHLQAISGDVLPPTKKDHAGIRLLLVRHGETNWNRDQRFQGQIDIPLNTTGEQQAQKAADFLAQVKINQAFSSSMLRPKQTAEIILTKHPHLSLQLTDLLKEISHGKWEGKLETEIEAEFPGELQRWQSTPESVQMPEGENLNDVWARVKIAWQQIIDAVPQGETAMVVAHDAVNKAILCQLFNLSPASFWAFKQGNGAVSVIDYPHGDVPVLQSMNITTHLSNSVLDSTAAGAL